jgi:5-methyltetrahydropteroyltriglutamate--homocysteine methyltransferase
MKRSMRDHILTTHTGSLARPPELRAMLRAVDTGSDTDAEALEASIRDAVNDRVARQAEIGLSVINDGEQSKPSYTAYLKTRLCGFETQESEPWPTAGVDHEFPGWAAGRDSGRRPVSNEPLAWKTFDPLKRDIANLLAATRDRGDREVFMTAPSPGTLVNHLGNHFYTTRADYLAAAAELMQEEYEAIVSAGFLLQLDCPDLASARDRFHANLSEAEFRAIATENVAALNWATRNITPERMRMHVCWGALGGPHTQDVPLVAIADILVTGRPAGLCIVAANGRHAHEWRVWQTTPLPHGKVLIPGVIDSTSTIVEHRETVAERIEHFVRVLGPERIIAGVDCGLATAGTGAPVVDPDVAWAKLRALVEGAALISQG